VIHQNTMSDLQLVEQLLSFDDELSISLTTFSFAALITGFLALLLFDDAYPTVLNGKKSNGDNVQLPLCPDDEDVIPINFDENQILKPALTPCIRYVSTRGLDRILTLINLFFGGLESSTDRDRSRELCGRAGLLEYCFLPCSMEGPFIVKDPFQFACYVYTHGQPKNPNLLPADVELLVQDFRVTKDTIFEESMKFRICVPNFMGGGQTYCLPRCTDYNFLDFETEDKIPPCTTAIQPSYLEQVISNITENFEEPFENERELCYFPELDEQRLNCTARYWRMCRADNRGVYEIPPGTDGCCLYLNGPSAAVGVAAATGISLFTTNAGSLGISGGLYSLLYMSQRQAEVNCRVGFCRSRRGATKCCEVFITNTGRSICPVSCDESDDNGIRRIS